MTSLPREMKVHTFLKAELFERRFLSEANLVAGVTDPKVLWNEPICDNFHAFVFLSTALKSFPTRRLVLEGGFGTTT